MNKFYERMNVHNFSEILLAARFLHATIISFHHIFIPMMNLMTEHQTCDCHINFILTDNKSIDIVDMMIPMYRLSSRLHSDVLLHPIKWTTKVPQS